MRKVGIVLIVCLLAAAGIMAAVAYSNAEVTNALGLTVVNTNNALLAITPNTGVGYADAVAVTDSGKLVLNFAAGYGGGNFGFQPGAEYVYKNLFFVKNNSGDRIKIGLRFDCVYKGNKGPTGLHTVSTVKKIPGWAGDYKYALMHFNGGKFTGGWNDGRYIVLEPGEEVGITFDFNLKSISKVSGSEKWILQVHSAPISSEQA